VRQCIIEAVSSPANATAGDLEKSIYRAIEETTNRSERGLLVTTGVTENSVHCGQCYAAVADPGSRFGTQA